MAIELHTLTLKELLDRGESFLFPGNGVPDLIPPRMWRLVQANPEHPPELPVLAYLLANGKRASSITLPNQTVRYQGNSYPCLWGHLWANLEGNPLPGAGALLLRELIRKLLDLGVGFGATGPTRSAAAVMERLDVRRVTLCPRYALALGADSAARTLVGTGRLGRAASIPIGVGAAAWARWAQTRLAGHARDYRRQDLDVWDGDLRVLRTNPKAESIHVGRSREFVAWKERFSRWSAPDMTPCAFSLIRADESAGYVNMRHGVHPKLGSRGFDNARLLRIMDCVTDSKEATAAALYHAIAVARENDCDFLELVSNDPWLVQVARHAGLKESNGMGVHLRCPEGWPREFMENPDLWNIGLMESDGAFAAAPVDDPAAG